MRSVKCPLLGFCRTYVPICGSAAGQYSIGINQPSAILWDIAMLNYSQELMVIVQQKVYVDCS